MICSSKHQVIDIINKALKLEGDNKLKPEDIELYQNDYVTEFYENSQADVVYKITNKDKTKNGKVFIEIEHQSTKDPTINNRIREYRNQIIRNVIKNNKKMKIPKVYSIVIYSGEGEWDIPNKFRRTNARKQGNAKHIHNTSAIRER